MKGIILSTEDIEGTKLATFQEARKFMSEALKKDPGYRIGYLANIAMTIYDNQHRQPLHTRYKLNTVIDCEKMANDLIKLIFDS